MRKNSNSLVHLPLAKQLSTFPLFSNDPMEMEEKCFIKEMKQRKMYYIYEMQPLEINNHRNYFKRAKIAKLVSSNWEGKLLTFSKTPDKLPAIISTLSYRKKNHSSAIHEHHSSICFKSCFRT